MNVLTKKEDDVVVYIATTTEIVSNGILVDNEVVFGNSEQYTIFENVTVPSEVSAQAYKYTVAGGFVKNEDYVPYVSPEERIAQLEADVATANYALMMGGLI